MTIPFEGAIGDLFNRLGRLGKTLDEMRAYQAAQLTNFTDVNVGVVGQYNLESDVQALMGSSYIDLLDSGASSIGSVMQGIATATANRMVFRDNPQFNQTLVQGDVLTSLLEIIRQMRLTGDTVLAQTVTATPSLFTLNNLNTGNGVAVASVRRPGDGLVLENAFAENLTLACSADSYLSGAAEDNESFSLTGEGQQGNLFAFNWPLGSNCSVTIQAIDGNTDNGSGNLLTNSGFEEFTDDVPDNWALTVGVGGVNIFEETGIVFDPSSGGKALRIFGAGGTQVILEQEFDDGDGTAAILDPLTQYAWNGWLRRDGVAAAAGVLTIELVDGNDQVVQDEAGNNNSFTIDLTALSTVYTAYNTSFRTPHVPPETYKIRYRLSTALTNGRSVYMDLTGFGDMTQAYTSGPYVAVFSGSIPFIQGDFTTITVTNSRGTAGTLSTFQTLLAQLYGDIVYSNELIFPSSATPSISDTLMTS